MRYKHGFAVGSVTVLGALMVASGAPVGSLRRAHAADAAFTDKVCGVLKEILPAVRGYRPEGVQAQLVMGLSGAFDGDPAQLRWVAREIDPTMTAGCPQERQVILAILDTKRLQKTVR